MPIFYTIIFLIFSTNLFASEWVDISAIERLFTIEKVTGTMVVYDVENDRLMGANLNRAKTQFEPASTFKIPNTLIGLSVGAVESVDEILPYGDLPQPYPMWEADMSLKAAFPISNVPIYQALARRITLGKMAENIAILGYGNADIGLVVDRFWLDGPLKISAIEQVQFLANLAQKKLPFADDIQQQVHEIALLESTDDFALYGKTGWANTPDPDIGWWVGWLIKDGKIYSFALNLDMTAPEIAAKRISIGRESLAILGLLPNTVTNK